MLKLHIPIILIISVFLISCSEDKNSQYAPTTIKVGIVPDAPVNILKKNYAPLLQYLENKTGRLFKLVIPSSYEQLLQLFSKKEIDLAYFGAYTFWQAHVNNAAIPLIMRNVDASFSSYIFTHSKHNFNSLKDLEKQSFSFGSKLSTSGHIMPRFYLEQQNINPEDYFSKIDYSGGHHLTIKNIITEKSKAGVANALIVEEYINKNKDNNIKILWISPSYPDYVWAVQSNLSTHLIKQIHGAYLELSIANDIEILQPLKAKYFISASPNDFEQLEQAIENNNKL